jgi:hypothetical protein
MRIESIGAWLILLLAYGCTVPPAHQTRPSADIVDHRNAPPAFGMRDLTEYMEKMSDVEATALKAEIKRLQSSPNPTAGERLKLAWLLDRDAAPIEDLTRAQELLSGLDTGFGDPSLRAYVRLMQWAVTQELLLHQEHKRADDLQGKIDRLKDLEQNLQERSQAKPPAKK